jgi:hypothetical protein
MREKRSMLRVHSFLVGNLWTPGRVWWWLGQSNHGKHCCHPWDGPHWFSDFFHVSADHKPPPLISGLHTMKKTNKRKQGSRNNYSWSPQKMKTAWKAYNNNH